MNQLTIFKADSGSLLNTGYNTTLTLESYGSNFGIYNFINPKIKAELLFTGLNESSSYMMRISGIGVDDGTNIDTMITNGVFGSSMLVQSMAFLLCDIINSSNNHIDTNNTQLNGILTDSTWVGANNSRLASMLDSDGDIIIDFITDSGGDGAINFIILPGTIRENTFASFSGRNLATSNNSAAMIKNRIYGGSSDNVNNIKMAIDFELSPL